MLFLGITLELFHMTSANSDTVEVKQMSCYARSLHAMFSKVSSCSSKSVVQFNAWTWLYACCVIFSMLLDLPPSLVWLRGLTMSCASGETGKLCIESHSSVSIPVTAVSAAFIGWAIYWLQNHHMSAFTSLWTDDYNLTNICVGVLPPFSLGGTGSNFPCKV